MIFLKILHEVIWEFKAKWETSENENLICSLQNEWCYLLLLFAINFAWLKVISVTVRQIYIWFDITFICMHNEIKKKVWNHHKWKIKIKVLLIYTSSFFSVFCLIHFFIFTSQLLLPSAELSRELITTHSQNNKPTDIYVYTIFKLHIYVYLSKN